MAWSGGGRMLRIRLEIDVEANDLVQFSGKLRIVGQLELADPVRLAAMSTPYPLHRAHADPGGLRHRRTGPVTGSRRQACQRQGDHTFSHLGEKIANATSDELGIRFRSRSR